LTPRPSACPRTFASQPSPASKAEAARYHRKNCSNCSRGCPTASAWTAA
jgi:hypothetical protein